jgi:hypothetical protein
MSDVVRTVSTDSIRPSNHTVLGASASFVAANIFGRTCVSSPGE